MRRFITLLRGYPAARPGEAAETQIPPALTAAPARRSWRRYQAVRISGNEAVVLDRAKLAGQRPGEAWRMIQETGQQQGP